MIRTAVAAHGTLRTIGRDNVENHAQLPRLEPAARVLSLSVHVPRMIPERPAPGRSSPPRSRSARTGIPPVSLVSGSERFNSLTCILVMTMIIYWQWCVHCTS